MSDTRPDLSTREQPACCPWCLSTDPNKVGVEKATDKVCRNEFHCPCPEYHGSPFRMCPYCDWREDPLKEPPAGWAIGWAGKDADV